MEGRRFPAGIAIILAREGLAPVPSESVTFGHGERKVVFETVSLFSVYPARRGVIYLVTEGNKAPRHALLVLEQKKSGMRMRFHLEVAGDVLTDEEFEWSAEDQTGHAPPDAEVKRGWLGHSYVLSETDTNKLIKRIGAAGGFSVALGSLTAMIPGAQPIALHAFAAAGLLAAGVAILEWIDAEGGDNGIYWGQTWALAGWVWHNPPPKFLAS